MWAVIIFYASDWLLATLHIFLHPLFKFSRLSRRHWTMNTRSEKKTRRKNKSNSKQLRILIAKIFSHYKSVENDSVHFVETIRTIRNTKFHFELWTISNYKNSMRHLFLKKNSSSVRHFFPMTPLCPSAVCLLKRFQNVEVWTQIIFFCVCFRLFLLKTERTLFLQWIKYLYAQFPSKSLSFRLLWIFLCVNVVFDRNHWYSGIFMIQLYAARMRGFRMWFNLLNWKSGNSMVVNGDPSNKIERKLENALLTTWSNIFCVCAFSPEPADFFFLVFSFCQAL